MGVDVDLVDVVWKGDGEVVLKICVGGVSVKVVLAKVTSMKLLLGEQQEKKQDSERKCQAQYRLCMLESYIRNMRKHQHA